MTATGVLDSARPTHLLLAVVAIAGIAVIGSLAVVESQAFHVAPHLLGAALALDLAVVVPAAFYVLVVRRIGVPWILTVPVFVVSAVAAIRILPADHAATTTLGLVVLPAGVLLFGAAIFAVRELKRGYQCFSDERGFDETLPHAVRSVFGSNRLISGVTTECLVAYYALWSWRRRPAVPEGAKSYTSHREAGWAGVFIGLILVVAIEVVAVHVVFSRWNSMAAWALTGAGLYGLIWLIADYRAMVLKPIILTSDTLWLRVGFRWKLRIPISAVRMVRGYEHDDQQRGAVALTVIGQPKLVLELARPFTVAGLFGVRRRSNLIAIAPDGETFAEDLEKAREEWREFSRDIDHEERLARDASVEEGRGVIADIPGPAKLVRWLVQPLTTAPAQWAKLNVLFLAVLVLSALACLLFPGTGEVVTQGLLASGAAKLVMESHASGFGPTAMAGLIFANNFAVVMVFVVGISFLRPHAGVIIGLLLAVPFGLGTGFAITAASPVAGLLAVAPIVLLEQQAVVVGMLFSLRRGRVRGGGARRKTQRSVGGDLWCTSAAVAAFMVLAAVCETILLLAAT